MQKATSKTQHWPHRSTRQRHQSQHVLCDLGHWPSVRSRSGLGRAGSGAGRAGSGAGRAGSGVGRAGSGVGRAGSGVGRAWVGLGRAGSYELGQGHTVSVLCIFLSCLGHEHIFWLRAVIFFCPQGFPFKSTWNLAFFIRNIAATMFSKYLEGTVKNL